MVVSKIFYFHPYLGEWSNLTNGLKPPTRYFRGIPHLRCQWNNNLFIFMKGPRTKPSRTPMLVGRGYPRSSQIILLMVIRNRARKPVEVGSWSTSIISRVFCYISGGCLGFLPSTVKKTRKGKMGKGFDRELTSIMFFISLRMRSSHSGKRTSMGKPTIWADVSEKKMVGFPAS